MSVKIKQIKIIILVAALAILSVAVFGIVAAAEVDDGETPVYTGSCGPSAAWNFDPETGELYVRGSGKITVAAWSELKSEIKSVVIAEGVTEICKDAFTGCRQLKRVYLSSTVNSIGDGAFYLCEQLKEIDFSESLTRIGNKAFYSCGSLELDKLPDALISVGDFAFYKCKGVRISQFPSCLSAIGKGAFFDCTAISENLYIPSTLTSVDPTAFENVNVYFDVASDNEAYSSSNGLLYSKDGTVLVAYPMLACGVDLHIEASVEKITYLDGFETLKSLTVDEDNSVFFAKDNVLYNKDATLIIAACGMNGGSVTVPNTVIRMDENCFAYSSFSEIIFEKDGSIIELPVSSFAYMSNLKRIVLPSGLEVIPTSCFNSCTSLAEIVLPSSVSTVENGAFNNCPNITHVFIKDLSAFLRIEFKNQSASFNADYIVCNGETITDLVVPNDIVEIKDYALRGANIRSLTIHDEVTSVGKGSFSACTGLINLTLGKGIQSIGYDAFYGNRVIELFNYSSIDEATISGTFSDVLVLRTEDTESVLYTDDNGYVFITVDDACYLVAYFGEEKDISLPLYCGERSYSVYSGAFSGTEITGAYVPQTVISVEAYAFNCDKLKTFTMAKGVQANGIVVNGSSLYSVTVPDAKNVDPNNESIRELFLTAQTEAIDSLPQNIVKFGLSEGNRYQKAWGLAILDLLEKLPRVVEVYNIDYASYINTGMAPEGSAAVSFDDSTVALENGSPYYNLASWNDDGVIINQDGFLFVKVYGKEYNYVLLGYVGDATDLIIPDEVAGDENAKIYICRRVFQGLDIESLYIPSSVVHVDQRAFADCTKLIRCTIASDNVVFEANVFAGSAGIIESVGGASYIGQYLYEFQNVEKIVVREGTVAIMDSFGTYTSEYGSKVKSIVLPSTLKRVGDNAFASLELIESIVFPDSVEYIGEGVFRYCESLKSVVLPNGLKHIGKYVFEDCLSLESLSMSGQNSIYSVYGNMLIERATSHLLYAAGSNVAPDETVLGIASDAIRANGLVYIPESVCGNNIPLHGGYHTGYKILTRGSTVDLLIMNSSLEYAVVGVEEGYVTMSSLYAKNTVQVERLLISYISELTSFGVLCDVEYDADAVAALFEGAQTIVFEGMEYTLYSNCQHEWEVSHYVNIGGEVSWGEECSACHSRRDFCAESDCIHELIFLDSRQPSCAEGGWSSRYVCSKCSTEFVLQLPATGNHSYSAWSEKVAPAHLSDGLDESTCADCGNVRTRIVSAFGHTYTVSGRISASCTVDGQISYECACGDSYTEITDAAYGHQIRGYWSVFKQPTCTEQGERRSYCRWCYDYYETQSINALGHNTVTVEASDATCTESGWEEYSYCTRCQSSEPPSLIPATGHAYGEGVVTAPTCTENGYTSYICVDCGHTHTDSFVDAYGHLFKEGELTTHPTCTEQGEQIIDCERCNYYGTVAVPATGHAYESVISQPTCVSRGYTTHICTACGDNYVDSYTPIGDHEWGEWSISYYPTCETEGEKARRCEVCHTVQFEDIPIVDHNFSEWQQQIEPTCQTEGVRGHYFCNSCGRYFDENEQELFDITLMSGNHKYVSTTVLPTCTDRGYTIYTCSYCGEKYENDYVYPSGHNLNEWVDEKPASCVTVGKLGHYYCSVCQKFFDKDINELLTLEIPATGHSYSFVVTEPTCTDNGFTTHTCTCGDFYVDTYVVAIGHTEVIDAAIEATCTESGLTEGRHCSVCDAVLTAQKVVPAKGHSYGEWATIKEPTEAENGEKRRDCSACDAYETDIVASLSHDHSRWGVITLEAVAPTCTKTGLTEGKRCFGCGETLIAQEVVPALGHDETEHKAKAPTCTEIGWDAYVTCSRCDYTTYSEKAAIGHTDSIAVEENRVDATCTENGSYDSVIYCSVCNTELSRESKIVVALGHDEVAHEAKAPTCTEIGWDAYVTCSRCNYTTYSEKATLSHTESATVEENRTEATCTANGSYDSVVYCSVCGVELSRKTNVIDALEHEYNSVVTEPSCIEQGYTTHTCRCGDTFVDTYTDALGHSFRDYKSNDDATCTVEGTKTARCERCDALDTVVDPDSQTEHSYDGENDTECNSCGATRKDESSAEKSTVVVVTASAVATVGIGGFSLFWFVIKKKSVTDIIAIFKK